MLSLALSGKKHHPPKFDCEVRYGWFVPSTLQSNTAHINIAQQCHTQSKPAHSTQQHSNTSTQQHRTRTLQHRTRNTAHINTDARNRALMQGPVH
jgi:hypothetical protein